MMKKGGVWLMMAAVISVMAVMYHSSPAQTGGGALKLAVVDVIKVLTECQENKEYIDANQKKVDKMRTDRKQLAQESDDLKMQLEQVLEPGSEGYKTKLREWINKQAQLKAFEESESQVMKVESQVFMETLYRKMLDEIASISRLEGYDLVLETQDEVLKARSFNELEEMVRSRKVLFHSAGLDLTTRIIENLNRKYDAQKAGQG